MNVLFDQKQLLQLVTNLYVLTGMTANILDPQGQDINLFKDHPPFCKAINALPEGHERCVACDAWKVRHYTADKGFQFYRCHAGICEALMPLYDKQHPLAYLIFGCFLDDTPMEEQWQRTRPLVEWYPGGADRLRDLFFQFRQYTAPQLSAYAKTLEALAAYIQLKGMILATEQTDRRAAHWPHQALPPGQGALRRAYPLLPHRPAAHGGRQGPAGAEQPAGLRRGGDGGHQRL